MNNNGGNIPILGAGGSGPIKAAVSSPPGLARIIEPDGTIVCVTSVVMPNGQVAGIIGRSAYMDANELLDAIEEVMRRVVREEIAAAAKAP